MIRQQTLALSGDPSSGYAGTLTMPVDFAADRGAGMAPPAGGGRRGPPPGNN